MPVDQLFVCCLVLVTVGLFIWERIPVDIVAAGALLVLLVVPVGGHPVLWAAEKDEQLRILGRIFANDGVLTVIFMFIIGMAMDRTGVVSWVGEHFDRMVGAGHRRTLVFMAVLVIVTSAFMNNTTVVIMFLPVIMRLCRNRQTPPSRFLMPLSYFAIAGGLCTMIGTSTNLIVNGKVVEDITRNGQVIHRGLPPFTLFEITPIGLIFSAVTVGYLVLLGRKLLPDRVSLAALLSEEDGREFLTAAIISTDSPLAGKTITETPLAKNRKMRVIEVRRSGTRIDRPLNEICFEPGDRIILKTHLSGVVGIDAINGVEMAAKSELGLTYARTEQAALMEGMIGPHSRFVGHTLRESNFRQQYGVLILAVHRQGENLRDNFENVRLQFGDTLLLEGTPERVRELFNERDFINLTAPKMTENRTGRAWVALLAMLIIILGGSLPDSWNPPAFQWVALTGALLVTLGGCLRPEEAYDSIEWRIVVMIFGALALGLAMERTGAAKTLVTGLLKVIGGWDLKLVLSAVLLFSIIFTELLSNNAVAALLTPLVIQLGHSLQVDPRPFVVAVMMGASIGFAIPTGYQTHMMVYGAGGYRFTDFIRAGLPLDFLLWIVGSLCIPLFWSF